VSVEAAVQFVERVGADDAFLARVVEAPDGGARAALAKAEGYQFEQDELEAALDQLKDREDSVIGHAIVVRYGAPSFFADGQLTHDPFWTKAQ
jgi:predicted ribosomally synthesized peptide with nif11-like leader